MTTNTADSDTRTDLTTKVKHEPYTKDDFLRDMRKVAKRPAAEDSPSRSDQEKR